MGAAASVEFVDEETAKQAAGDLWPGTPRFHALVDESGSSEDGKLSVEAARTELERLKGAVAPAAAKSSNGQVLLADPVVSTFPQLTRSSPAFTSKDVSIKLEKASLSDHEALALTEARRG